MRKRLLISAALMLAACSSEPETHYYQLPQPVDSAAINGENSARHQLWVEQVSIPDFLAGNGIVYQTSDVQYTTARNSQWANPLDQQLKNSLITNLSSALPDWVVVSSPSGREQQTLKVNVLSFQGRYDGKVVVSGEWLLSQDGRVIKRPFHVEMAQQGDGYAALVKALGAAWQQASNQIATQIAAS